VERGNRLALINVQSSWFSGRYHLQRDNLPRPPCTFMSGHRNMMSGLPLTNHQCPRMLQLPLFYKLKDSWDS